MDENAVVGDISNLNDVDFEELEEMAIGAMELANNHMDDRGVPDGDRLDIHGELIQ